MKIIRPWTDIVKKISLLTDKDIFILLFSVFLLKRNADPKERKLLFTMF